MVGDLLEGLPARIDSAAADREADEKPCRERKGVKSGGLLKKNFTRGDGKWFPKKYLSTSLVICYKNSGLECWRNPKDCP
jgi:hypothetical protein